MGVAALIMMGLSLGKGIYKGIKGRKQKKEAQALEDEYQRPEYEIPPALQEAMGLSKERAQMKGVKGEDSILAQLGEDTQKAIGGAQDTGASAADVLFAGSKAQLGEQRGKMQLGVMGGQAEEQRMKEHLAFLPQYGAAEDKKWDINEYQPYAQAMQKASQLREAGEQNVWGAVSGTADDLLGTGYAMATGSISGETLGFGGGKKSGGIATPGGTSNMQAPSDMFPASGGFNPANDFESALTQGSMQPNYLLSNRSTPQVGIPEWF